MPAGSTVTIRVELPASVPRVEAFDAAERQILALKTKIKIKFDRDWLRRRPFGLQRAELERFRKTESQLFVIRAWIDPQDIPAAEGRAIPSTTSLATRGWSRSDRREPTMASPTSVLQSALARVDFHLSWRDRQGRRYGGGRREGSRRRQDPGRRLPSWTWDCRRRSGRRHHRPWTTASIGRGPPFLSRPRWVR